MTAPTLVRQTPRALCCDGRDTDDWHPIGDKRSEPVRAAYARARAVCRVCPLRLPCLRTAAQEPHHGCMRAGLTPEQLADEATVQAHLNWLSGKPVRLPERPQPTPLEAAVEAAAEVQVCALEACGQVLPPGVRVLYCSPAHSREVARARQRAYDRARRARARAEAAAR
ncbi:WhiB family transcriptional regulator [Frankia sp. Mgl5]|uniref:WhiB family transcriptional regulator n=1 Tax=Frankia sp. Mgl5 TaxID=2933793 RepID=UPI00200F6871|nr:WhiB family transcriptional regulator [Frankia sp. Mgl5]MCK9930005.1 WhiB family transcriptional regulator [Frankia sp. Mgl5]